MLSSDEEIPVTSDGSVEDYGFDADFVAPPLPPEIIERIAQLSVEDDIIEELHKDDWTSVLVDLAAVSKAFRRHVAPVLWRYLEIPEWSSDQQLTRLRSLLPAVVPYAADLEVRAQNIFDLCHFIGALRNVDFEAHPADVRLTLATVEEDDASSEDEPWPVMSGELVVAVLASLRSFPKALAFRLEGVRLDGYRMERLFNDRCHLVVLSLRDVFLGLSEGPHKWLDLLAGLPHLAALQVAYCDVGFTYTHKAPRFAALRFASLVPSVGDQADSLVKNVLGRSMATLEGLSMAGNASAEGWNDLGAMERLDYLALGSTAWNESHIVEALKTYRGRHLVLQEVVAKAVVPKVTDMLRTDADSWPNLTTIFVKEDYWPPPEQRDVFERRGIQLLTSRNHLAQTLAYFSFTPSHCAVPSGTPGTSALWETDWRDQVVKYMFD